MGGVYTCHRLTYHCIFGVMNSTTKSYYILNHCCFSFHRHFVFLVQRNRYVITPQSSCEPVAVYGTGRGTFRCI